MDRFVWPASPCCSWCVMDRLLPHVPAQTPWMAMATPGLDASLWGRMHGGGREEALGVTGQRKDWLKGCCRQVWQMQQYGSRSRGGEVVTTGQAPPSSALWPGAVSGLQLPFANTNPNRETSSCTAVYGVKALGTWLCHLRRDVSAWEDTQRSTERLSRQAVKHQEVENTRKRGRIKCHRNR